MATATVAELDGVTRRFGQQIAVDHLDLTIPRGGVYALLGPNGAGKTTTINLLLGLLRPDAGTAKVFGLRPGEMDARRAIGTMLQVSGVPATLTVREHVEQFSGYYPAPLQYADVIARAGLAGLDNRRFGKLSGGQKQRVLFALAICGDPELLFLDEPTVGLDVEMRRRMWSVIRELGAEGRTIVLTTHYLEEADTLAGRIGVLSRGRLVAEGTPAEIKARVGGRIVRCATVLDETTLRTLAGVRAVRQLTSRVELAVDAAEPLLCELLARDPSLSDLEVIGIGLDDAFLSLTDTTNGDSGPESAEAA
ncbi:MAG: ATP-binding cassette domain-containing protein [Woeseiaceae bacterium]